MASEITIQARLSIVKNSTTSQLNKTLTDDLTGDEQFSNTQALSTSNEAVDTGDIAAADVDWIALLNLDAAINIAIYEDSGDANLICTLGPGQMALLPNPGTLYATAASGTPLMQVVAAGA